jgi:biopolymer transport protein ExbD
MAEINHGNESKKTNGKVRLKKQSTKIDMTPMVDLAFLLLTFFILTSTFNDHKMMDLQMPSEPKPPQRIQDIDVLNLVLAENDKIYWWTGLEPPASITNYSKDGVRKVLLEKKSNPHLMVLIKPKDDSKYQNMIDILDELEITDTKRYAVVDFTDDDKRVIGNP